MVHEAYRYGRRATKGDQRSDREYQRRQAGERDTFTAAVRPSDGRDRRTVRVDRRWFFVSDQFRVEPSATPGGLLEPAIERALRRMYDLPDGNYTVFVVVLPVDDEGKTYRVAEEIAESIEGRVRDSE